MERDVDLEIPWTSFIDIGSYKNWSLKRVNELTHLHKLLKVVR